MAASTLLVFSTKETHSSISDKYYGLRESRARLAKSKRRRRTKRRTPLTKQGKRQQSESFGKGLEPWQLGVLGSRLRLLGRRRNPRRADCGSWEGRTREPCPRRNRSGSSLKRSIDQINMRQDEDQRHHQQL